MREGGAATAMIDRVAVASRDEIRHRELCANLTGRLGYPPPPFTSQRLQRIAPHDLGGGGLLCYEMVACLASEPGWRSEVSSRLPRMLAATTHDEPFLVGPLPLPESPALLAHGLMSQDGLRRLVKQRTIEVR